MVNKFFILLILFSFIFYSCRNAKDKSKHKFTVPICDKSIYVESFLVFSSGAYGGDMVSDYITDSVNFKMYVGTFDNGFEFFTYKCSNDSLFIIKGEEHLKKNTMVDTTVYLMSELKRKKIFD